MFYKAAKKQDIPEGVGVEGVINGKSIALFNVGGKFYAIDNLCPHQGGPLAEGDLCGTVVTCPWHAWQFDVCSGADQDNPENKIETYKVEVVGDDVMVELP